jgi:hypothetical protein
LDDSLDTKNSISREGVFLLYSLAIFIRKRLRISSKIAIMPLSDFALRLNDFSVAQEYINSMVLFFCLTYFNNNL